MQKEPEHCPTPKSGQGSKKKKWGSKRRKLYKDGLRVARGSDGKRFKTAETPNKNTIDQGLFVQAAFEVRGPKTRETSDPLGTLGRGESVEPHRHKKKRGRSRWGVEKQARSKETTEQGELGGQGERRKEQGHSGDQPNRHVQRRKGQTLRDEASHEKKKHRPGKKKGKKASAH